MRKAALLLLLCGASAWPQVDGITASASRTVSLTPDEAVFAVAVTTGVGASVEQVVALLQETGVTARDLLAIGSAPEYYGPSGPTPASRVTHQFGFVVPYSRMKETADKLDAARKNAAANDGELQYSLTVSASEKAFEEARQRLLPELVAEARKSAEALGAAADMTVGSILSVSENTAPAGLVYSSGPYLRADLMRAGGIRAQVGVFARFAAQPR